MTSEEAMALALDWAEGRRSHMNVFMDAEASTEMRPQTLAAVAQADAAEVVKWCSLANALPAAVEDATLLERCPSCGAVLGPHQHLCLGVHIQTIHQLLDQLRVLATELRR